MRQQIYQTGIRVCLVWYSVFLKNLQTVYEIRLERLDTQCFSSYHIQFIFTRFSIFPLQISGVFNQYLRGTVWFKILINKN